MEASEAFNKPAATIYTPHPARITFQRILLFRRGLGFLDSFEDCIRIEIQCGRDVLEEVDFQIENPVLAQS
jgi:hypothetical protein